jgi:uncharacterized protein YhbP (UPF0306 family)
VSIQQSSRPIATARITTIAHRVLGESILCAIGTVTPAGRAHVNTAYFAWSPELILVWLSSPQARHSRNLVANSTAAIAVYDSTQVWGEQDRGIQLFGSARPVSARTSADAEQMYASRFPAYAQGGTSGYAFYRFRPRRVKLFDEAELGEGVFVTATARGGQLTWQRTEIYRPGGPTAGR